MASILGVFCYRPNFTTKLFLILPASPQMGDQREGNPGTALLIKQPFIYLLSRQSSKPGPFFFFTNDVTLSCLPHECAGYRPLSAVPEPSTWAMMLIGFAGLGFAFRQLTTEGVVRLTNESPREKQRLDGGASRGPFLFVGGAGTARMGKVGRGNERAA